MLEGWINIFRTGIHTSSNGVKREWKLEDLQQLVNNFNPDDRVPLVVGHPKENSPAFGWISDLKIESGNLFAKFADLHDGFKEAVRQGLYRNRSVSIGKTENGFKLFHLGWLGGVLPAVEGLDPVKYNSDIELDIYEFNIQTKTSETKEMLIEDDIKKAETPKKAEIPKSDDFAAIQKEVLELRAALSEKEKALSEQDDVKALLESFASRIQEVESLNSTLKKENEGLAVQFAQERHTRITTEFNIFLEEIERNGVNLPAAKEDLIAFSLSLEGHSFKTKEGEKDGMEFMKTMLSSLTPVVELGSMFDKEDNFSQPEHDETAKYVDSIVKMANQKMGVANNA